MRHDQEDINRKTSTGDIKNETLQGLTNIVH